MPPVPVRRPVAASAPAAPRVAFGLPSFYFGGSQLPEGDYAALFSWVNHQPQKQDGTLVGKLNLNVKVLFFPLAGGEPITKYFGTGDKTIDSYQPDETGKGLVQVPNSPGLGPNRMCGWNILRESMAALDPEFPLVDDFTTIDGIQMHCQSIDEPEERKGFKKNQSATAEVNQGDDERRGSGKVVVCTQILAKPWNGECEVPEAPDDSAPAPAKRPAPGKAPAKAAAPAAKPAAKAPVKAPAKAAPAPAATETADVDTIGIEVATNILVANAEGMDRNVLRMEVFKAVKESYDAATANAVNKAFFANDDALNGLVGQLNYVVDGKNVVPMS